jgi:hypothetical protein
MIPWQDQTISPGRWAEVAWGREFDSLRSGDVEGVRKLHAVTIAEGLGLIRRGYPVDDVLDAYNEAYRTLGVKELEKLQMER